MKVLVVGDAGHTTGRASQPGSRLGLTVSIAAMIGSLVPSCIQARQPFWASVATAVLGNATAVHRASHVLRSAADEPVFKGACS